MYAPSSNFHIFLSDIHSMDWFHCGIVNPHSITKITKFLQSFNRLDKPTDENIIATDNSAKATINPSKISIPPTSKIFSNPTSNNTTIPTHALNQFTPLSSSHSTTSVLNSNHKTNDNMG